MTKTKRCHTLITKLKIDKKMQVFFFERRLINFINYNLLNIDTLWSEEIEEINCLEMSRGFVY